MEHHHGIPAFISMFMLCQAISETWKINLTQILNAIVSSLKCCLDLLRMLDWLRERTFFGNVIKYILFLFWETCCFRFLPGWSWINSLHLFELEFTSCGTENSLWTTKCILFLDLKQISSFFTRWRYGRSVSMPTNNTESPSPFSSQVLTESHLSSYYSQFISIQNIDHLLGN